MGFVAKACLALMLSAAACTTRLPGEEVGTYQVHMALRENTCGEHAVHLQQGRSYKAQLRQDDSAGYWRVMGQQPLTGAYEDGEFAFTFDSAVAQSPPDAGTFCQLLQSERLSGRVMLARSEDAGTDAAADAAGPAAPSETEALREEGLTGEHRLTISAAPGTDCSEELAPSGPFQQLPCTVRYTLTGTPTDSF